MGGKHATEVARLVHQNLRRDTPLQELTVHLTGYSCHLTVRGRRAFLLGAEPVPVSVWFIHGADIIEVDAILPFSRLEHVGHIGGKVVVGIIS